jgi:hypothetical protein
MFPGNHVLVCIGGSREYGKASIVNYNVAPGYMNVAIPRIAGLT